MADEKIEVGYRSLWAMGVRTRCMFPVVLFFA